jgi:hypothetical protein
MLQVTTEELNFALWYIKQRGFAVNDDKSSMAITVEGMDYLEKNRPAPDAVLKFIKPDSLLHPGPADAKVEEPVMNVLSRAIQRHSTSEDSLPRVALRQK